MGHLAQHQKTGHREMSPEIAVIVLDQKTVPGRVRVKFAQNRGHEKVTKKARTLFF